MASLETRNGSYRVVFRHDGVKHHFTIGEVSKDDAATWQASTQELLRLLKRNVINVPSGCSIEEFMFHRGKPPEHTATTPNGPKGLTLSELRQAYLDSQFKKLEQTTLDGIRLHFDHLTRILGVNALIPLMKRPDLQRYVDKRSEEWIDPNIYRKARRKKLASAKPGRNFKNPRPPKTEEPDWPKRHPSAATIKKEIVSLRTAWNWSRRHLGLIEEFPGTGLDFAKITESMPFMTWKEAERRIAAGDDPEQVWDCVYLRPGEIDELLKLPGLVDRRSSAPWSPMWTLPTAWSRFGRRNETRARRQRDVSL